MENVENLFGEFEIVGKLGSGGMGNVYKALEVHYNRLVALKIAEPSEKLAKEDILRFETEAQSMKQLDHQNIVPVFGYGQVGQRQYISMKYVDGKTLSQTLQANKLSFPQIVDYAKQLARGLRYAHQQGIIHRDVKPSNILCNEEGRLYLFDFGISFHQDDIRLTHTGMAMGTPEYMSPEQCQGENISSQSDIYSFGIILYEMICGLPPFRADKPLAIAYKQVHEPLPNPTLQRSRIPDQILKILQKSLAKAPKDRYSNFSEVLQDLDQVEFDVIGKSQIMWDKFRKQETQSNPILAKPSTLNRNWILGTLFIAVLALFISLFPRSSGFNSIPFEVTTRDKTPLETSFQIDHWNNENYIEISFDSPHILKMIALEWKAQQHQNISKLILESPQGHKRVLHFLNNKGLRLQEFAPIPCSSLRIYPKSTTQNTHSYFIKSIHFFGIPFSP